MSACFKVYGPFEIPNKQKIYNPAHQEAFWTSCEIEQDNFELSLAKGIYLFSLRNATNYSPQYVGMTSRDFRTEVFNDRNLLRIITTISPNRGVLCHSDEWCHQSGPLSKLSVRKWPLRYCRGPGSSYGTSVE